MERGGNMQLKEKLESYLIKNCKIRQSIENKNKNWHTIYIPLINPELDTEHQKQFHNDAIIPSKYYKWHSGGADIGDSFNYAVKRILNDFKKGIIKLEERI